VSASLLLAHLTLPTRDVERTAAFLERAFRLSRVPVPDNVLEYAVGLVHKTRPGTAAPAATNQYISYGAGPRASQYLILGAKCSALMAGKFSPDIEDVQAMAMPVLRHRVVRNYKAEAEGISQDELIKGLL
jgi:MoxR-like ATPase